MFTLFYNNKLCKLNITAYNIWMNVIVSWNKSKYKRNDVGWLEVVNVNVIYRGFISLEIVYDILGKCFHSYLIVCAPYGNIMQHIFVLQTQHICNIILCLCYRHNIGHLFNYPLVANVTCNSSYSKRPIIL